VWVRYDEFIDRVAESGIMEDRDEAVDAVEAVLETLGERLTKAERENLAAQLPNGLKEKLLKRDSASYPFLLEEFYKRVGARAGIRYAKAVERTRTIMRIHRQAVSPGEIRDILHELPDEYKELFGSEPESPLSPSSVE
jgi:uncharacterized protein (DUF2267 family)